MGETQKVAQKREMKLVGLGCAPAICSGETIRDEQTGLMEKPGGSRLHKDQA